MKLSMGVLCTLLALTIQPAAAEDSRAPQANEISEIQRVALDTAYAQAAPSQGDGAHGVTRPTSETFNAGEFSIDLFGTYADARPHGLAGSLKGGEEGIGIAANYFFHRNAGVQLDSTVDDVEDITGGLFDHSSVSLVVRLPLGSVAPYALAGGGRDWNEHLFTTHAGAGLEWRVTKHFGVIGEARWQWGTQSREDQAQFRAGVRFTF